MSQRQGPPESEAAATLELLSLREEISDLALREGRLRLQVMQLQSQIASYQASASSVPERLAALQAQLADAQEQLARLAVQKEALAERRQAAQKRLHALRASFQSSATWRQSAPPWEKPPSRRRARKPLVMLVCGLLLIALVGTLARFAHFSPLGASLFATVPTGPSEKVHPPEAPPFFTPAKTAPTNQGCLTTIRYHCYSPQYIQQAFGLTPLYREGYNGRGQTIVLIGAGNVTNLKADLRQFDLAWGLPDPNLTILYPDGLPAPYSCPNDADLLAYENTLSVEWAHALAPGANIVLLIGSNLKSKTNPRENCQLVSLQRDIAYALDHPWGNIISIGTGSSELGNPTDTAAQEAGAQNYFANGHKLLQRAARAGVTVLAAAGNSGATNPNHFPSFDTYWLSRNVAWPASDPNALAVGGTTLTLGNEDYDDAYVFETAWGSPNGGATGGGLSSVFAEPDYQQALADQTIFQGKRGIPDVAFPAANLLVYYSAQEGTLTKINPQWQHWDVAEGTNVAVACWAALIAIANQMRGQPLGLVQPALYSLQGQGMHDITTGNNTYANVPGYQAQTGYDLVTGWGTPIANQFLPLLLRATDTIHADCSSPEHACT